MEHSYGKSPYPPVEDSSMDGSSPPEPPPLPINAGNTHKQSYRSQQQVRSSESAQRPPLAQAMSRAYTQSQVLNGPYPQWTQRPLLDPSSLRADTQPRVGGTYIKSTSNPPLGPTSSWAYTQQQGINGTSPQSAQKLPLTSTASGVYPPHLLPKFGKFESSSTQAAQTNSDWCPLDDGIGVNPRNPTSREEMNACIDRVLYGPSRMKRLPVLVKICPE